MKRIGKWLKGIYLAPFILMMMNGGGDAAVSDDTKQEVDAETQAAINRGDIYTPPEQSTGLKLEPQDDPAILAKIAEEQKAATDDEPTDDKKTPMVPLPRLNEVLERQKALEAELAALKAGQQPEKKEEPQPDPVDETKKELRQLKVEHRKALSEALLDADDEEAQARVDELEDKIEALQDKLATAKVQRVMESQTATQAAKNDLQTVLAKAYEDFPFLNPKSPDANADLNDDIIAYRDGLVTQGVPLPQAVQRAVNKFAPAYAKEKGFATPDPKKAEEVRLAREKAAREKNAAASVAQPAALPGKGEKESFTIDVTKLTPAQIKALPEETKARLRGDAL